MPAFKLFVGKKKRPPAKMGGLFLFQDRKRLYSVVELAAS